MVPGDLRKDCIRHRSNPLGSQLAPKKRGRGGDPLDDEVGVIELGLPLCSSLHRGLLPFAKEELSLHRGLTIARYTTVYQYVHVLKCIRNDTLIQICDYLNW